MTRTVPCPVDCGQPLVVFIDTGDPNVGIFGSCIVGVKGPCPHVDPLNQLIEADQFGPSWVGHRISEALDAVYRAEAETWEREAERALSDFYYEHAPRPGDMLS